MDSSEELCETLAGGGAITLFMVQASFRWHLMFSPQCQPPEYLEQYEQLWEAMWHKLDKLNTLRTKSHNLMDTFCYISIHVTLEEKCLHEYTVYGPIKYTKSV